MKKLFLLLLLLPFLAACEQVDTGYRGVKTRFGKVDMQAGSLPEGLYFYNLFTESITEMDTRILKYEGKANTYTKDVQQADIVYVVNYRLAPETAHIMYQQVGKRWGDVLLLQAVEGELKKVIGKYDAVDLIAHRGKATQEALEAIRAALKDQNIGINEFQLVNIQYLKEFEKSVEDKVIATQKAAEAVNNTKRIQEEAKQTIISAQADAESMRIRANALSQNKALVDYEMVMAWKAGGSKVPETLIIGNGSGTFLNLPAKVK